MEHIKNNFAKDKSLFEEENIKRLFKWWQNKMVHSRVGQVIHGHYSLLAHKDGKIFKGDATIRDTLYQVEMKSKRNRVMKSSSSQNVAAGLASSR